MAAAREITYQPIVLPWIVSAEKLGSYVVVGATSSNKSNLLESYPGIAFVETLEEGMATDPHVVLVTGALVATREWFGNLARLAVGATILVLDDIRTLSGYPRRNAPPSGISDRRAGVDTQYK